MLFRAGWPNHPARQKPSLVHGSHEFDSVVQLLVAAAMSKICLNTEAAVSPSAAAPHQRHGYAIDHLIGTHLTKRCFDRLTDPLAQPGQHAIELACPPIERALA